MKAIAFAIILGAVILIPRSEYSQWTDVEQAFNGLWVMACIVGFWVCIFREK